MHRNLLNLWVFLLLAWMWVPALHAQDTRENADFKLAVGLYNDRLYPQAEDQFKSFIDRFPNSSLGIESRYYLGLVEQKLKKYSNAASIFQDFALRYPDHPKAPEALWSLGDVFAAEGQYGEAGSAYARIKTFYPKYKRAAEALLQASGAFAKAGDLDNAKLVLNALLTEYPQSDYVLEATLALGRLLIRSGDYDRAIKELTRVQNSATSQQLQARAILALGELQGLLGNPVEAEEKFRDVIARYARTDAVWEAWVRLGDLQRSVGKYADAAASYDAVLSKNTAPVETKLQAMAGAAEAAAARQQYDDAVKKYDAVFDAMKDQPPDQALYFAAAAAARKAGKYAKALSLLGVLARDTISAIDHRVVYVTIAETAREGKQYTAAIQAYQRFLTAYPSDPGAPSALLRIGTIYEGDLHAASRAAQTFESILERYGNSAVADHALEGRAQALESLGRFDEAAETYRQVAVQYPSSVLIPEAEKRAREIGPSHAGSRADAIAALARVVAAMHDAPAAAHVNVLLGGFYLDHLRDDSTAVRFFDAAVKGGLSGADAEAADAGIARATANRAARGDASREDAGRLLSAFLQRYPVSAYREEIAYQLYLLRTRDQPPAVVLDAASQYIAGGYAVHALEVSLASVRAMRESGRAADAEKECTRLLSAFATDRDVAMVLYERARCRAALQQFTGAADDLLSYDREAPNGADAAEALYLRGTILARTGRYEDAASAFDECRERFPWSPLADSSARAVTAALADGGMTERAVMRAAAFLKDAQSDPFTPPDVVAEALYTHAVMLARAKNAAAAKHALQEYASTYPTGSRIGDVYYALGRMYREEGNMTLATSYMRRAASDDAKPEARQDAADLLLEDGRYDDAIREYDRIAQSATSKLTKSYALSRIVVALYRSDKAADAKRKEDEFKAAYPDAAPVFAEFELERGKGLFRQKKYDDAKDVFEECADGKSPEIAAWGAYWIGKIFETRSDNAKAEKQFTSVTTDYPKSDAAIEASLALGRMAFRAEKYDAAAIAFRAVADAPRASIASLKEALNGLIVCYDDMKMYDGAAEMTKRFLATWPSDPTAFRKKINLGVYYTQLGYFDQAVTHFESLLPEASTDDQAEIRYYIGEAWYYKGDYTQSALEFLKVPYLVVRKTEIDWTASSYYMAGQSYEKQGKFPLALDMYQKITSTPGIDARYKAQAEKEIDRVKALIK